MCDFRLAPVVMALLFGLLTATPAQAQDGDGIEVDGTTTYRLDPEAERVRVRVEAHLTNTRPSQRRGNYIETPYLDSFGIPALGPVRKVRAESSAGGRLSTDVEMHDDGISMIVIDLSPNLIHGSPQTITVDFNLPGQPARSDSVTRVNEAFANWFVFGTGDPGNIEIVIDLPRSFQLSLTKDLDVTSSRRDDRRIHRIKHVPTLEDAVVFASASDDTGLASQQLSAAGTDVTLKAWPNDAKWRSFAADTVEDGLPVLVELVGLDVPEGELTVVESGRTYQLGYGGFYDPLRGRVEVGDRLDHFIMLHELSHAWFNHRLFVERWLNEGLADEFANRAMTELGKKSSPPDPIDRSASAAVALNEWPPPTPLDPASLKVEDFAYNASHAVIHEVVDDIGLDGLRTVIAAAKDRQIPYQGDPAPEEISIAGDWRYFYDLAELVAGSQRVEGLFRDHVLSRRDIGQVRQRATALAELDELVAAGNGWTPPFHVRERMAQWDFDEAETLMDQSHELLARVGILTQALDALGTEMAADLETRYESSEDLDEFDNTLGAFEQIADSALAVQARWDGSSPIARIGLLGTGDSLTLVASAIGEGDVEQARTALAQASQTIDGAAARGARNLLALVLLVGMTGGGIRARRVRRARNSQPTEGAPMLRKLEASHDNIIGYSAAGDVTEQEYLQTASELRDAIALHGKVRLLFRISEVTPQSFFTALDERFRFAADHRDDIERIAIVSDDKATEWLTRLAAIGPVETEHFPSDEEDKAWAWLD